MVNNKNIIDKHGIYSSGYKYSGSKRRLLPHLKKLFPSNINTFYDLFGGSGIVSINVDSKKTIYSDTFTELVDYYNYIKNNDVEECLNFIQDIVNNYNLPSQEGLKKLNSDYNNRVIERNPLILLLFCIFNFKGLVRKVSDNFINVTCNLQNTFNQRRIDILRNVSNIIKSGDFTFNNKCYSELDLTNINKDDFIYLDPPYFVTDTSFYSIKWTEDDEKNLLDFIQKLIDNNIQFGLSNLIRKDKKVNYQLIKFIQKNNNKIKVNILKTTYFLRNTKNKKEVPAVEVYISNVK